jgi:hypothetical protein
MNITVILGVVVFFTILVNAEIPPAAQKEIDQLVQQDKFIKAELIQTNGEFFAHLEYPIRYDLELASEGGIPKLLSLTQPVPGHTHLWLLAYDAGCAGTMDKYQVTRAALFDSASQKILVDATVRYQPLGHAPRLIQPEWKFFDHAVKITDSDFALTHQANY